MTTNAAIVYDGEFDLNAIQFCKIESQQECLAGTLCIPRLSDVCGSKYKIQFFVNSKNIVIGILIILAIIVGLVLGFTAEKFKVITDDRIEMIQIADKR